MIHFPKLIQSMEGEHAYPFARQFLRMQEENGKRFHFWGIGWGQFALVFVDCRKTSQ